MSRLAWGVACVYLALCADGVGGAAALLVVWWLGDGWLKLTA
jgi:hypothetical protein